MRWLALPIAIVSWAALAVAQPVPPGPTPPDAALGSASPDGAAAPSAPAPIDASTAVTPDAPAGPGVDAGADVAAETRPAVEPTSSTRDAPPLDAGTVAHDAARLPRDAAQAPRDAGPGHGDAMVPAHDAGPPEPASPPPPHHGGTDVAAATHGDASPPSSAAPATTEEHAPVATTKGTLFALKVIIGLIVLAVLAYLGGHRRVVKFQEQLGISGVITAGFPFVALGLIASEPSIGILSPEVIDRMRPILHFGLGWLGFIIGAQLDIRVLDRVPKGTAYLILVEALGPFAITAAGCGAVMITFGLSWKDPSIWRDLILLGTAAAMTAPRKFRGFANRTWREGRGVDILLGQLDEIVGVIGLLFITAYFRDTQDATWQIPSTAWVFVSLGLGVTIGVLIFAMIRVPKSNAEFLAVVLGGIAFASGLAGYLELSPIVICFLAGALVTNFPNEQRDSIFRILNHLERPVHMLFLIVAGAVWDVTDWRGWALAPLFVVGRIVGKYTGVLASRTVVGAVLPAGFATDRKLVTPMSGLSIGLVISVASLYADTGLAWVMTAVIGGSILSELLVQATTETEPVRHLADPAAPSTRVDELDDSSGPVYADDLDEGGKR